jgi:acyl carrier protein
MTTADIVLLQVMGLVRPHTKLLEPGEELDPERELLDLGVDSFSLLEFITDVETKFGIMIPDELLNPDTFRSTASVSAAVAELLSCGEE